VPGSSRTVRLDPDALSSAEGWIAERRAEWKARADRLENYLSTLKSNGES
jgi:hypothetical protein